MKRLSVFAAVLMLLSSCRSVAPVGAPPVQPAVKSPGALTARLSVKQALLGATTLAPNATARPLAVYLFPWIPDPNQDHFASLIQTLTSAFDQMYPDVAVTITMDPLIDTYDPVTQAKIFQASGPQAVELDTISLGDLVVNNYVAPVSNSQSTFTFAFASNAATIDGTTYAMPTWVCMYFFYGSQNASTKIPPAQPLATPGVSGTAVSGIWNGSLYLPSLYLMSWTDTYGYQPLGPVMNQPPDPTAFGNLQQVMANCTVGGANPCLNSTFKNGPVCLAQREYVTGAFEYTTGFSEDTYCILSSGGHQPQFIAPMRLGPQQNPLAFTDGLVVNAAACTGQCVYDVYAFTNFLNDPDVRHFICYSGDAPAGTPPRYLSPAGLSFYSLPQVANDWYYQQFQAGFTSSHDFPNQGIQATHKQLNQELCSMLQTTIPDACLKKPKP